MAKVKIYTTTHCVYCKVAKQFFQENNIEYQEFNVGEDVQAREEMINKTGQLVVPVIEIDEHIEIGFNKSKIKEYLKLET